MTRDAARDDSAPDKPPTRDSTTTRDQILDAVTSLLATRGPEHATVRKVAAEAGLSAGAVQHHFATRDELIAAAYDRSAERFRAALQDAVAGIDDPATAFRVACHQLAACADDSESTRNASATWLAFAGIAATGGPAAPAFRDAWQTTEDHLAAALGDREEAALLLAMLDGIAVARLTEPERMTAERGRGLIDRQLARLAADGPRVSSDAGQTK
ncbi:TetR/AcrR family transcriptional regulator [uncultured Corynebacterium sp.]|uniref:TetR/AcrR family transcriptional regulator n=1 Tax=uncultured Corynebacterium sp. TaxID=159447 RepID=UPI0025E4D0D3|nr:TetR/AcrR family transcriptional regulator [uncultured Corynebacterium sp.]